MNEQKVEDKVSKMEKIEGTDDMARMNARLMEDVVNDSKMTTEAKITAYSKCVRNQCQLSANNLNVLKAMAKLGLKPNGQLNALLPFLTETEEKK